MAPTALLLLVLLLQDSESTAAPAPPLPAAISLGDLLTIPLDRIGAEGLALRFEVALAEPFTILAGSYDADVTVAVEDQDGNVLASDDDGGTETNAHLVWTPAAAGAVGVRIMAKDSHAGSATMCVLRGAFDSAPPEPALAVRSYWELAYDGASRRGDGRRAELALDRLSAGEPPLDRVTLHAALDAMCAIVEHARALDQECQAVRTQEDLATAHSHLLETWQRLSSAEGAAQSALVSEAAFDLGLVAYRLGDLGITRDAWEWARRHRGRTLRLDDELLLTTEYNLATMAGQQGDLTRARSLYESILEVRERTLPSDHRGILIAQEGVAWAAAAQGDHVRSRSLEEDILAAYERTLPPEHPSLLRARGSLAATLQNLGELPQARSLFESLIEVRERTLPEDHPDLVWVRNNLAITAAAQRDFARARPLYETVLAARERTLPEDHPDLLQVSESLAVALLEAKEDLPRARSLLEGVLEASERTLPEDHPDLVRVRDNLAKTAFEQGDFSRARTLMEQVLEARERTQPADHAELLQALIDVAKVASAQGDLSRARALYEHVLEVRERTLATDHPDLVAARFDVGATAFLQRDLPRARALYESVLEADERTLPADHPDLLMMRQNVASAALLQNDLSRAQVLSDRLLEDCERTLPADHPQLLAARELAALLADARGEPSRAGPLLESVLEARARVLPADHPELLRTKLNIAARISVQDQLARARALVESVLEVFERTLPADHPERLDAEQILADTLTKQGDLTSARVLEEQVLAALERSLPSDHPDLVRSRRTLAFIVSMQGDISRARALLESVLAACERTLPADHLDLLQVRAGLADCLRQQGDLPRARALAESVLESRQRSLPEDHLDLLRARESLAIILMDSEQMPLAGSLFESVLAAYERILPVNDPAVLSAQANLAVWASTEGDHARARALQESVLAEHERTLPDADPTLLASRHNLAVTLMYQGDLPRARALQAAVLAALERTVPQDHPRRLAALGNLAVSDARLGATESMEASLERVVNGYSRQLRSAAALAPREVEMLSADQEGPLCGALAIVARFAPGAGITRKIFGWIETRRALADVDRDEGDDEGGIELAALRASVREARSRSADLVSSLGSVDGAARSTPESIAAAARGRDAAERALAEALAERGIAPIQVSGDAVASALGPGEAAVGLLRYHRFTFELAGPQDSVHSLVAHVVLPDGSLRRVELGPLAPIEEAVRRWREAIGAPVERGMGRFVPDGDALPALGTRVRELVLDPILAVVGDAKRLHLCLDGALRLVPLEALPLGEGVVGDRYTIRNEVSFARLLREPEPVEGDATLLALGGIDFDAEGAGDLAAISPPIGMDRSGPGGASFGPLRQTRYEVEGVEDLFEQAWKDGTRRVLTKDMATKAAFEEAAPHARWLHLATHGYFSDSNVKVLGEADPNESALVWQRASLEETVKGLSPYTLCGLAFAGANRGRDSLGRVPGILTAEELMGLDLRHCELAVLSACETFVGLDRGASGLASLQAALHAAGVRTAITSLWKVDDERTRELMTDFYRRLWVEGRPVALALWEAKCAARTQGWPVRDWSGWILTGDPGDDPDRSPAKGR